jgi:diguanylate cyclase (GGDEF)-like protein/PAS domain S-box-containing protein
MDDVDKSGMFEAIMASAIDYAIVVVSRDGEIATWNAGAEQLFGYSHAEIIGRPADVLFTAADRANGIPEREMATAREQGRAPDVRWHQRKDGSCFWADGVMQPMLGADGSLAGFVKILRDATADHEHEVQIARLARTDPLTGLANRTAFAERFKDMTAAALRHRQCLVVHVIDLDHFKEVNDRFGHHIGDLLLKEVARQIRQAVRDTDFVGRLGGDEFVVLQADAQLPDLGSTLAEKLVEVLTQTFSIDGKDVRVGASIGITVFPQDDADPDQLLRKADLALYEVKAEGRNGYHYFSQELEDLASQRNRALTAVKRALANQDFSVVYQPKISVATGEVAAVEALLRCHDRALSQTPIEDVIKLAVEAGLMEELGLWVMAEACAQTRRWQQAGLEGLAVCVNLCAAEMADPALPVRVAEILAGSGLDKQHLLLEVTEHEMFDSGPSGQQILEEIRALGVQVSLDDFGTGFSSLGYLTDLQVDEIKLDRSFLRNVPEAAQDCTVVSAILSMARGLHLTVVAEGVETAGQVEFFVRERCDWMQGFFFSPALPPQQLTPWLLERIDVNLLPPEIRSMNAHTSM